MALDAHAETMDSPNHRCSHPLQITLFTQFTELREIAIDPLLSDTTGSNRESKVVACFAPAARAGGLQRRSQFVLALCDELVLGLQLE
jgi:hypothetical protein